jgi:hypothetical protein
VLVDWLVVVLHDYSHNYRYVKPKKLPPIDVTMCRAELCGLPPDRSYETACSDGRQQVTSM